MDENRDKLDELYTTYNDKIQQHEFQSVLSKHIKHPNKLTIIV